jgi:hypothetical protein
LIILSLFVILNLHKEADFRKGSGGLFRPFILPCAFLFKQGIKRVDTRYISKELEGFMARWYIAGIADSAKC